MCVCGLSGEPNATYLVLQAEGLSYKARYTVSSYEVYSVRRIEEFLESGVITSMLLYVCGSGENESHFIGLIRCLFVIDIVCSVNLC
jgi:hypothetical protein